MPFIHIFIYSVNAEPYPIEPVVNSIPNHSAPPTMNTLQRADSINAPTAGQCRIYY